MASHTLPGRGTAAHRARKLPANGIVTDAELGATADAPASRRDAWCAHRLFAHRCAIRDAGEVIEGGDANRRLGVRHGGKLDQALYFEAVI